MNEDVYDYELVIKKNDVPLNLYTDEYPDELFDWIAYRLKECEHFSGNIRVEKEV